MQLSRTEVREAECPECGARPGKMCWAAREGQVRASNHRGRYQAAARLGSPPPL